MHVSSAYSKRRSAGSAFMLSLFSLFANAPELPLTSLSMKPDFDLVVQEAMGVAGTETGLRGRSGAAL